VIDNGISNYYSKAYVRHLFKGNEILGLQLASLQNLACYLWLVGQAREHIIAGDFDTWRRQMIPVLKTRL
jgi:queuine tRNA-ribosyltransferase